MILIIGGAYQGKLDYARKEYGINQEDIFDCRKENEDAAWPFVDKDRKCWNHFEAFVYACVKEGIEAREYLEANSSGLSDKIIISDDVSQGVVPVDDTERAFREECGRCLTYLASEAEEVIRVFCGLPCRVK